METMEDAGSRRQMFYDIECVIDDCDADAEYKPLSDSDELDECADEHELRADDIDSSEEWEPLRKRSRAKRQQHGSPSASGPRRRGRPRKHPSQPFSLTAERSSSKYTPYFSSEPRCRGRPPKDKSQTILMPKPSPYPVIIPEPLTAMKLSPNSTPIPCPKNIPNIKLSPNSSPIHTPNPASISFSNSTHTPLHSSVSSTTFASNSSPIHTFNPTPAVKLSPDSTHTITVNPNPTPITTLICTPAQATLLLDMDNNKRSHLCIESATLEEKVDSVEERVPVIQQSLEHSASSTLIAKRQRLSSPSPPAITPIRRRGRPRKHALKIISNSTAEPATTLNPIVNPATDSNLTSELTTTSNPTCESTTTSNPTCESTTTSNPTCESTTTSNPTIEPAATSNLTSDGPLANGNLEKDSKSDEISGLGEEDLWKDCVEFAEDSKPLMKQNPRCSTSHASTSQTTRSLNHVSKCTSQQQRDMSPESTSKPAPVNVCEPSSIPNPTMMSSSSAEPQPPSIPVPTPECSTQPPRRRGRPPKCTLKPIPNTTPCELASAANPITPPKSKTTDPEATPSQPSPTTEKSESTSTSAALDLPRETLENIPELDKWHDVTVEDKEPELPDFHPKRPPGPQLTEAKRTPLQLFQLFFTSSVIETIVRNTNSYAEKRTEAGKTFHWVPLTVNEFYSYLALVLYMGLVKVNTLMDYWVTKTMYSFPYPQSVMSRSRFQAIFCNLHLSDPQDDAENDQKKGTAGYDRLLKIKPLYTDIVSACRTHFHPDKEVFVDERLGATKSKRVLKRFLNGKSHYRLFVLADSSSGYYWNIFVYDGKSSRSTGKGVAYDSVMRLLDLELLGKGYRLYTNSFYTSPTLFGDLLKNDTLACGFFRHCFGLPKVIGSSSRAADRGSIRWCRRGPLLFVRWMDVREIVTCSTMHKAFAGRSVGGVDGQIPVPPSVKDCSKYMCDEDSSDALLVYQSVLYNTSKWYKTFLFHFLEIAVVNSYVLHQHMAKAQNEAPLSQKAFRETLISELDRVGKGEKPSESDLSTSELSTPPSTSPTQTEQCMPEYFGTDATAGRRACAVCRLSGRKVKTPIFCSHCRVPLCFVSTRNCFTKWHIERHLQNV